VLQGEVLQVELQFVRLVQFVQLVRFAGQLLCAGPDVLRAGRHLLCPGRIVLRSDRVVRFGLCSVVRRTGGYQWRHGAASSRSSGSGSCAKSLVLPT
jgi:hypothetical protein